MISSENYIPQPNNYPEDIEWRKRALLAITSIVIAAVVVFVATSDNEQSNNDRTAVTAPSVQPSITN